MSSVVSDSVTKVRGEIHYCERDYSTEGNKKNTYMYIFLTIFSCAKTLPVEHFLVMYTNNCIYTPILFST